MLVSMRLITQPFLDRVRRRIGDKHVLRLVKAFCKAGVLTEQSVLQESTSGTPQGGILSPENLMPSSCYPSSTPDRSTKTESLYRKRRCQTSGG